MSSGRFVDRCNLSLVLIIYFLGPTKDSILVPVAIEVLSHAGSSVVAVQATIPQVVSFGGI